MANDRIRVRKDDVLRGWVDLVGVNAVSTDDSIEMVDEWVATKQSPDSAPGIYRETFPTKERAIAYLLDDK